MGNWGKTSSPSNPGMTNYVSSTSTQTPPPYVQTAYQNLINRATGTANAGFTPYTEGFGSGQPQFNAATGALDRSMVPTYASVNQYMSPYISSVVDATKRNMQETNAQQQQQVIGNAISKGAYGGNRVGVAQAELARQQALANNQTIADLYSKGYDTALGAAQSDKSAAQASAAGYGNLGQQAQQLNYSQYLNQQGFPYAQGSWLSSILGGIGPAAGGTTAETTPDGNIGSQLFGGLTSLFGLLSDRRAKEDVQPVGKTFDGQPIYSFRYKGEPNTQIGLIAQDVEKKHPEAVNDNGFKYVDYAKATEGAARKGHFAGGGIVPYGISDVPYSNDNELFPSYIPAVAAMHGGAGFFPTIKHRDESEGQQTMAYGGYAAPRGYASGGRPYAAFLNPDPSYINDTGYTPLLGDAGEIVPRETSGDVVPFAPVAADPATAMGPAPADATVFDAMPYAPTGLPAEGGIPLPASYQSPGTMTGPQFATQPTPGYSQNLGDAFKSFGEGNGLNLSPDVNQSLISAGAAMMSSKRPFALSGVGEGITAGVKTWNERQALERENARARSDIAYQQGTLTQAGQRLWLDAQKTAADIGLTQAQTGAVSWEATPTPAGIIVRDTSSGEPGKVYPWGSLLPTGDVATPGKVPTGMSAPADAPTAGGPEAASVPLFGGEPPPMQPNEIDTRLMSSTTAPIVIQESSNAIQSAREQQQASSSTNQMLQEMQHNLDTLPDSGLLTQGTGFEGRVGFAKGVNTLLQGMGYAPAIPEDQVAAGEDLNKLTTRLGQDLNKGFGSDNAATVVMAAISAVPGGANSKEGAQRIISGLEAMNQRRIDYYNYLQKWSASHYGSILGADEVFNRLYPPERYALSAYVPREAMEDVRTPGMVNGLTQEERIVHFNEAFGNGRDVAQYVVGP